MSGLAIQPDQSESSGHSYSANLPLNDALPYFDREIETHPGLQGKVEREIKDEMAAMKLQGVQEDERRLPPASVDLFKVSHGILQKET